MAFGTGVFVGLSFTHDATDPRHAEKGHDHPPGPHGSPPDAAFRECHCADEPAAESTAGSLRLGDAERRHVLGVLRRESGNKVQAAKALGISRRALYRLIAKHQLEGPTPERKLEAR